MLTGESAQQALEEYRSLREEILLFDKMALQSLAIVFSATGLIFGQALVARQPWIFLLPVPILWSMYFYVTDKRFGISVIAAYIVAHLESDLPGLNWETRLRRFRTVCDSGGVRLVPGQNPMLNECFLFNSLILLAAALFTAFIHPHLWGLLPLGAWLAFLVFSVRLHRSLVRQGAQREDFVRMWRQCADVPSPHSDSP